MQRIENKRLEKPVAIVKIKEGNLCSGCGACYAICPYNAIDMRLSLEGAYRPFINSAKCKHCGLCERACPSLLINQRISTNGLGNFIRCYIGYSTDKNIRWNGSSGGIATAILESLRDEGAISGAVILNDNPKNPLMPLMAFVRTKRGVRAAMGSRYCPVEPCFKVKDLISEEGKIAVVGLPCHIWAFRQLEEINAGLKSKVFIHIGLLCGKCPNLYATTYFLRMSAKVRERSVKKLSYRGKGWPGKFMVETNKGCIRAFELGDWCRFSYYPHFIPVRCVMCYDISNQLADVSLGDAWGLTDDQVGTSVMITRTDVGEHVLQHLRSEGRINLSEASPNQVSKGQGLDDKVRNSLIRAYLWQKVFKQPIPFTKLELNRFSINDWIFNLEYCTLLYLSQNYFIRTTLCNLTIFNKLVKGTKSIN